MVPTDPALSTPVGRLSSVSSIRGNSHPQLSSGPSLQLDIKSGSARYFVEMSRDAFVCGGGWSAVWHVPLVLGTLGAFFFLRAWLLMRKMQVEA
jgi:hypothetical protein